MWYRQAKRGGDEDMKVTVTRSRTAVTLYVTKTFRDPVSDTSTSKTVERLGTVEELMSSLGLADETAVMAWAKGRAREMTEEERQLRRKVSVTYDPTKRIGKGERVFFNVGCLFLQAAYHALGIDRTCARIASSLGVDYDLDSILSRLVYSRILEARSRCSIREFAGTLAEPVDFDDSQVTHVLSVLARHCEEVQGDVRRTARSLRLHPDEEASFDELLGPTSRFDDGTEGTVYIASGHSGMEECFRTVKDDFEARLALLSNEEAIRIHSLTCFLALTVCRAIEQRLGHRWTCLDIVAKLREMRMERVRGEGWRPLYVRDELTDALHESFGFNTDYEIVPDAAMKAIFRQTKSGMLPDSIATGDKTV